MKQRRRRTLSCRRRRGIGYLELLISMVLLSIAVAGALSTWNMSLRAPANKRATEMGVFLGTRELERLKAQKYSSMLDTAAGSPNITYYDEVGATANAAVTGGYKVKSWVMAIVNRDGITNTEDLREITIEVWNSGETSRYETVRSLITFGGL